jgi:nickel transport protein
MRFLFALSTIFVVMGCSVSAMAHGTQGYVEKTKSYRIVAEYDDGGPMSYGEIRITAPNFNLPFQTGRTDRNGFFFFQPDEPGQWQIEVKDGLGHRLALGFEVGAGGAAPETVHAHDPMTTGAMTRPARVIAGLSILFGLSGFLYGWKARRVGA